MRALTSLRNWLIVALTCVSGWMVIQALLAGAFSETPSAPSVSSQQSQPQPVFTPAHSSVRDAINDFLGRHPAQPPQPIAFPHKVHLAKGLQCELCHIGVSQGPDAAIPSVKFCMSCHLV